MPCKQFSILQAYVHRHADCWHATHLPQLAKPAQPVLSLTLFHFPGCCAQSWQVTDVHEGSSEDEEDERRHTAAPSTLPAHHRTLSVAADSVASLSPLATPPLSPRSCPNHGRPSAPVVSRIPTPTDTQASKQGMPLRQYFETEMLERAARVVNMHAKRRIPARNASVLSQSFLPSLPSDNSCDAILCTADLPPSAWHPGFSRADGAVSVSEQAVSRLPEAPPGAPKGIQRPRRRTVSDTNV